MIVVLGASGSIGSRLLQGFQRGGRQALGTCCRQKREALFPFNLETMGLADLPPAARGARHLVVTAAASATIDGSRQDWERAHRVNVVRLGGFLGECMAAGITPVFISSDHVFDGGKGAYAEDDPRRPLNCYGRMKHELEERLLTSGGKHLIVRVGRVFGLDPSDGTWITGMLARMRREKSVRAATDQVFTPIAFEALLADLGRLMDADATGVFHLRSVAKTTHHALALALQRRFGLSSCEVILCQMGDLGLAEPRPKLIDLEVSKFRGLFGGTDFPLEHYLDLIGRQV